VLGTPVYMSPEQARGETLDHRTDIYALGVMAYELLTGSVPFKGQSSVDTLLAHQEEPVPSLRAKLPALPEELAQLIEAMLAKTPDERPTLAAVRTVLKRLRGTQIPTMTAAGLQIGPITSEQPTVPSGPLSNQVTVPRLPQIAIEPLPPPPAPPYAYPQGSQQIARPYAQPYSQPPSYAQQSMPHYSQPQFPSVAGLLPPEPASPRRRWIVIAIAAVIAAAIGVMAAVSL
jgi:serine/threonine protein kinase